MTLKSIQRPGAAGTATGIGIGAVATLLAVTLLAPSAPPPISVTLNPGQAITVKCPANLVQSGPSANRTLTCPLPSPTPSAGSSVAPSVEPSIGPSASVAPTPSPTPSPTPTQPPTTSCTTTIAAGGNVYTALAAASPGAIICLHGGAYSYTGYNRVTKAGTAAQPITVRNFPGETPVFSGTNTQALFMLFQGTAAYINVTGLTVNGNPNLAPCCDGGAIFDFIDSVHHITIDSNTLVGSAAWDSSQHAVYFAYASHDITISNNVIDGKGGKGAGLHFYHSPPTGSNLLLVGNTLRNWDQCVLDWLSDSNVVFRQNNLSRCRIGFRIGTSGSTLLDRNVVDTTVGNPVFIDSGSGGQLTQTGNSWQ